MDEIMTYEELLDHLAEKVYEKNKDNYVDVEMVDGKIVKTPQPKEQAIETAKEGVEIPAISVVDYVKPLLTIIEDLQVKINDLEERLSLLDGQSEN